MSSLLSYTTVNASSNLNPYSVNIGYPALAFITGAFGASKSSTYVTSVTSVSFPASSIPFAYKVILPSSFTKLSKSSDFAVIFPAYVLYVPSVPILYCFVFESPYSISNSNVVPYSFVMTFISTSGAFKSIFVISIISLAIFPTLSTAHIVYFPFSIAVNVALLFINVALLQLSSPFT